jgi:signal transduction histidine kinase
MLPSYIAHLQATPFATLVATERQLWLSAIACQADLDGPDEEQAEGFRHFLSDFAEARWRDEADYWPQRVREAAPLTDLLAMRQQAMLGGLTQYPGAPAALVAIAQALCARFAQLQRRANDRLLATLAHDLRSPLTSITGALSVLESTLDELVPGGVPAVFQIAQRSVGRLVLHVDTLLEQARPAPRKPLVVVADEDPAIRRVMQAVLEHHGYRVHALTDEAATLAIDGEPPAAVFVEAHRVRPVCAALAANPATVGVPVVMLSHVLDPEAADLHPQVVGRLSKPFTPAALLAALTLATAADAGQRGPA